MKNDIFGDETFPRLKVPKEMAHWNFLEPKLVGPFGDFQHSVFSSLSISFGEKIIFRHIKLFLMA